MPYVQRDQAGKIVGRFANKQLGIAEEFLEPDHPQLQPTAEEAAKVALVNIDFKYPVSERGLRDIGLALSTLIDRLIDGVPLTEADRTSANKGIKALLAIEALCKIERDKIAAYNALPK